MTPEEWRDNRERIWCWYMVEDKTLHDIIELLRKDGHDVKKHQIDYQLRSWKMLKGVKSPEAKWISSQLALREKHGQPTVFVKSGKRLSEAQIRQAMSRHGTRLTLGEKFSLSEQRPWRTDVLSNDIRCLIKLTIPSDIYNPPNPSPSELIACSPGLDDLPEEAGRINWSMCSDLPWLRLRRSLVERTVRLDFVTGKNAERPPLQLLPATFRRFYSKNDHFPVCDIATHLGNFMPELYAGEHIRRVHSIIQTLPRLDTNILELLLFQLSNNFVNLDFDDKTIVRLIHFFGLAKERTIRSLFKIANQQPTIAVVLHHFWDAAYSTGSIDLVRMMVAQNRYIHDGIVRDRQNFATAKSLSICINKTDLQLATEILLAPVSVTVQEQLCKDHRMLRSCTIHANQVFATNMATLILRSGFIAMLPALKCGEDLGMTTIHALKTGNTALANVLIDYGADVSRYYPTPYHWVTQSNFRSGQWLNDPLFTYPLLVEETVWSAAVRAFGYFPFALHPNRYFLQPIGRRNTYRNATGCGLERLSSQEIEIAKGIIRTYCRDWDDGLWGISYKFWPEDLDGAPEVDEADLDFWDVQYCDDTILENPGEFQQAVNGAPDDFKSLVSSENPGMRLHTRFRERESVDFHEELREFGQGQPLL